LRRPRIAWTSYKRLASWDSLSSRALAPFETRRFLKISGSLSVDHVTVAMGLARQVCPENPG